ncbi:hypothetical protein PQE70_gp077 [Bacillus phage vB_BanS_Nate]|uniref:Uncharacterized protein n=1 Tax=Bacillus phage vB_BanS_Nate TaxID=2894788 RepID=A0AAE8YUC7_9CAUD|nr:hypothetical protein PQE70_gp077 [Bacillus phage vB_BanS_Nate]UGO50930.1 hypothetical protein NATE_77 [Bacillus phage vB_BanS_Nate]
MLYNIFMVMKVEQLLNFMMRRSDCMNNKYVLIETNNNGSLMGYRGYTDEELVNIFNESLNQKKDFDLLLRDKGIYNVRTFVEPNIDVVLKYDGKKFKIKE